MWVLSKQHFSGEVKAIMKNSKCSMQFKEYSFIFFKAALKLFQVSDFGQTARVSFPLRHQRRTLFPMIHSVNFTLVNMILMIFDESRGIHELMQKMQEKRLL